MGVLLRRARRVRHFPDGTGVFFYRMESPSQNHYGGNSYNGGAGQVTCAREVALGRFCVPGRWRWAGYVGQGGGVLGRLCGPGRWRVGQVMWAREVACWAGYVGQGGGVGQVMWAREVACWAGYVGQGGGVGQVMWAMGYGLWVAMGTGGWFPRWFLLELVLLI